MSKKLLIYGLAFGSATASISYLYITKIAYSTSVGAHLMAILSEALLVPGIGIFLFLKNVKKENPDTFLLGRAVFMSFVLSIIIGASVSLLLAYLAEFQPKYIASLIEFKKQQFRSSSVFSTFSAKDAQLKFQEIQSSYDISSQFSNQLFIGGARGIFMGAIMGYFMRAKVASSGDAQTAGNGR